MRWCIVPHHWNRHHRRRRYLIVLVIGDFAVELIKGDRIIMATTLNVGQTLPLSIRFLDKNGQENPAGAPTPDTAPQWSQTNTSVELLTQTADGLTAAVQATATGDDTISLQLGVGGRTFNATLQVIVVAVQPTFELDHIEIVPGTPTP
jgi:hypothetical protein